MKVALIVDDFDDQEPSAAFFIHLQINLKWPFFKLIKSADILKGFSMV